MLNQSNSIVTKKSNIVKTEARNCFSLFRVITLNKERYNQDNWNSRAFFGSCVKDTHRPGLKALLSFIREGDIVVVSELDRLGRNNKELTEVMSIIQSKGATIEILSLPSLSGIEDENLRRLLNNLIIELYKYQAEAERIKILERQREGIEIAKRKGRYKGRKLLFHKNGPLKTA